MIVFSLCCALFWWWCLQHTVCERDTDRRCAPPGNISQTSFTNESLARKQCLGSAEAAEAGSRRRVVMAVICYHTVPAFTLGRDVWARRKCICAALRWNYSQKPCGENGTNCACCLGAHRTLLTRTHSSKHGRLACPHPGLATLWRAPPTACVRAFGRMQPCNGGALFTWSTASVTHCHFHSSFYFSSSSWEGAGSKFTSVPPCFFFSFWFLFHLYFPSHISKRSFLICIQLPPCHFSISSSLLSSSLPWAGWATAALSVRIWIIEVYWVWSADGEMAVMDPSALFRNHRGRANTCLVKARGVPLKLGSQRESRARHALKWKTARFLTAPAPVHTYTCRCRHAMATLRSLENVSEGTHVKMGEQIQTNKSRFNVFCLFSCTCRSWTRDFTFARLCLTSSPQYLSPFSAVGRHLSVPHRPAPFLHASATPPTTPKTPPSRPELCLRPLRVTWVNPSSLQHAHPQLKPETRRLFLLSVQFKHNWFLLIPPFGPHNLPGSSLPIPSFTPPLGLVPNSHTNKRNKWEINKDM